MDLSTWALLVIALVALLGSCLQRVSGMGLGLIGAPVLSLLIGPVAGVLIINVLAAVNAVFQTASVRDNVDWRKFWLIGPLMLAGAIPGAWVVHSTPTAPLQVIVGALVLVGLTVTTFMPDHMRVDGKGYAMASGAAGGFMNTLAGIAGPAITVYAQASRWPQKTFAATLQPLFFIAGAVSLAAKEISAEEPLIPTAPWHLWAIGIVAMVVGLKIGTRIAARTDARKARRLALIIASTGAAVTLVRGVAGMI
ncbi:sulfite exporter TauE/SafE family protein [Corynebacterium hansenii]|uniref:Probable membrane transporter protein n=1 Tax=Corynebacterium hansenii TaxID=394964 RepID=A0ABV7ZN58_9CORY|nr:sulfite exporter TauE/SafE family protein [Corynebacterium hansenii]WJZ00192.1 Sulfite exporter TauE/SafE [Corynebacterium hansenii]